jgi:hypothetical protein
MVGSTARASLKARSIAFSSPGRAHLVDGVGHGGHCDLGAVDRDLVWRDPDAAAFVQLLELGGDRRSISLDALLPSVKPVSQREMYAPLAAIYGTIRVDLGRSDVLGRRRGHPHRLAHTRGNEEQICSEKSLPQR